MPRHCKFIHNAYVRLIFLLLLNLGFLNSSLTFANIQFSAETTSSLSSFRAMPLYLEEGSDVSYARHVSQDKHGFLWISAGNGVLRYDGYKVKRYVLNGLSKTESQFLSFLHNSKDGQLWVGNRGLFRFDDRKQSLELIAGTEMLSIRAIADYGKDYLWLGTEENGLKRFNKNTLQLDHKFSLPDNASFSSAINSLAFDDEEQALWLTSHQGIFKYSVVAEKFTFIPTPLDALMSTYIQRDTALDPLKHRLWVGTRDGLLSIDTHTHEVTLYEPNDNPNSLPIQDITVTYVDSAGNVWVGLEKEGLCVHRYQHDDFICIESSFNTKNKIPFTTVEDIFEDNSGNLWLSMNNSGVIRITPDLEKFKIMSDQFAQNGQDYFPHSYDAIVLENKDIWFATDGGGINIFNHESGQFRNIKHDPSNPNSLPSNSVISLTKDEKGFIWASMWAGGISRIDPQTLSFTHYRHDPLALESETLGGNNVFSVESDQKGGLWLSIFGRGIQYFRPEEGSFKNFYHDSSDPTSLRSTDVAHLELYNDMLWIAGESGLEVLDIKTEQFSYLFDGVDSGFSHVWLNSLDEIYIATRRGLIQYNHNTAEHRIFTTKDGMVSNEVFYVYQDKNNKLWIGTNNGVSIYDNVTQIFNNYHEEDGLNGNRMSVHGEAFNVEDEIYLTGNLGVTIANPDDLPQRSNTPPVYIESVTYFSSGQNEQNLLATHVNNNEPFILPYQSNNLRFDFSLLNFIFPEGNQFKYRLNGWQSDFTETNSSSRFAVYTNLPPGKYMFEVWGAVREGAWGKQPDTFTFFILKPWYQTWWAIILFISCGLLFIYTIMRWRLSIIAGREKQLAKKVEEKTEQLNDYAKDLKEASDSLSLLNTELEDRVEQRTQELKIEISERKLAESKLFHMAFHDELTGLPNRQWTISHIEKLVKATQTNPMLQFGLMFLDGDKFKQINDTHGHNIGDQLLIASAERLSNLLSEGQYATRLGGDEFTVIIDSVSDVNALEVLAKRIIDAFQQPFFLQKNTIHFNASVGILKCDCSYQSVPNVLRDADIAMYRAKESGRGTFRLFDKEMRDTFLEGVELEASLRNALINKEFHLVYQPIVDLKQGKVSSFEALMRWTHPQKGVIPPSVFIPIAEESGIIHDLGKWLLLEACSQMKTWHDKDIDIKPKISVNISSSQLHHREFLSIVDDALAQSGLLSKYLILELTESVLIEVNDKITQLIEAFTQRNIDLAIDDFGTGYSSLSYLSELNVQQMKMDRKFVSAIDDTADGKVNSDALEIVSAMVSLGQSLQKRITAEGIETRDQWLSLVDLKCDYGQGFYLSPPLLPADVEHFLSNKASLFDYQRPYTRKSHLEMYQQSIEQRQHRLRDKSNR
jgi:diguanylate cyclase (GGDEF)-like protein